VTPVAAIQSRPFLLAFVLALTAVCNDRAAATITRPEAIELPIGNDLPLEGGKRAIPKQHRSVDAPGPPSTFKGYECTQDCSGHEAGYQWAEDHNIDDPDDCGGNSQSFIEGCQAYAEEQNRDSDDEDRNDEEARDE